MDPPFRIGRLRVRGQVAEIRAEDLRFAPEEAAGLLGGTDPSLDPRLITQLCGRTEGWAAGLVLAGLSLQHAGDPEGFVAAFRGDDHLVVEYLRDELLTGLDADDHRRLLETSVLDELTGDLVDAVTDDSGGAEWLHATARRTSSSSPSIAPARGSATTTCYEICSASRRRRPCPSASPSSTGEPLPGSRPQTTTAER